MGSVVITGSARGFGFELAKKFKLLGYDVCLSDINEENLKKAYELINEINREKCKVIMKKCDVTSHKQLEELFDFAKINFNTVDIWINNAGVNQPNKPIWELDTTTINKLIDIDLKGTILCSKLIMPIMIKQKSGQIYNVEGHGSNDAKIIGLSLYGTSKRAITYFTEALAFEAEKLNTNVLVGKITPGIMITNFINTALGDGEKITLDEKTKKVYNILGDYPSTIAHFMVDKIIDNQKNNVKFTWLTNRKAAYRFMTSSFKKRNLIK